MVKKPGAARIINCTPGHRRFIHTGISRKGALYNVCRDTRSFITEGIIQRDPGFFTNQGILPSSRTDTRGDRCGLRLLERKVPAASSRHVPLSPSGMKRKNNSSLPVTGSVKTVLPLRRRREFCFCQRNEKRSGKPGIKQNDRPENAA